MHHESYPGQYQPLVKADYVAYWQRTRTIDVPCRAGITCLKIVRLYECSAVDGLPLDVLIRAQTHLAAQQIVFGVVFSDDPPLPHHYPIHLLWRQSESAENGTWVAKKPVL